MVRTRAARKVQPNTPEAKKEEFKFKEHEFSGESSGDSDCEQRLDQPKGSDVKSPCPATEVRGVDKSDDEGAISFVIDTKPNTSYSSIIPGNYGADNSDDDAESSADSTDSESDCEIMTQGGQQETDNGKGKRSLGSKRIELSSSLQPGNIYDTYINVDTYKNPALQNQKIDRLLASKSKENELMKKSVLTAALEKKDSIPPYHESLNQIRKQRRAEKSQSKGKGWFDMKAQELTEEKKNEMLVLQMRRSLDPKRFYKAPDIRGIPKFFQMGKVIDGPGQFYNRIPKKQQKRSLVDELMADADFKKYSKRKFAEIQESKKHWKGAHKHMKRLKKAKK